LPPDERRVQHGYVFGQLRDAAIPAGMAMAASVTIREGCSSGADAAGAPAAGLARDAAEPTPRSARPRPKPAGASIEIASADALRILQQMYGGASRLRGDARGGSKGVSSDRSSRDDAGAGFWGLVAENSVQGVLVRRSLGLAVAAPLLVLGPWLNSLLGSLTASLMADVGVLQPGAVDASVSRAAQESALRIGGVLVTGGVLALVFKMVLTAPCVGLGGSRIFRRADPESASSPTNSGSGIIEASWASSSTANSADVPAVRQTSYGAMSDSRSEECLSPNLSEVLVRS